MLGDLSVKKIIAVRRIKGYSQSYMALTLNVSQKTYSNFESNKIKFKLDRWNTICKILEIDQRATLSDSKIIQLDISNERITMY